ncbi:TRAP transporter small permease [Chungangia koreensis]|uniref:TRAP transporter small permease n=1 Tax=Chungangia koreensis TaxID=752657 RepID=A0ABV8X363_9LACT
MEKLEKLFSKLENIFLILSQVALVIMMILTTFDAFSRYLFSNSIVGAYEVTEMYLMVALVFLSMSYVQKVDGHIRLDILFERFPKRVQAIVNSVFYVLAAGMMFFIGLKGLEMTINALQNNLVASGLINLPLWISYIWIPIGAFLIMVRLVIQVILLLIGREAHPVKEILIEEDDFE